jgi:hypothetical protein
MGMRPEVLATSASAGSVYHSVHMADFAARQKLCSLVREPSTIESTIGNCDEVHMGISIITTGNS